MELYAMFVGTVQGATPQGRIVIGGRDEPATKRCTHCNRVSPIHEFSINKTTGQRGCNCLRCRASDGSGKKRRKANH